VQCAKILNAFIGNRKNTDILKKKLANILKKRLANILKKKLALSEHHLVHHVYRQHSQGKFLMSKSPTGLDSRIPISQIYLSNLCFTVLIGRMTEVLAPDICIELTGSSFNSQGSRSETIARKTRARGGRETKKRRRRKTSEISEAASRATAITTTTTILATE
jgi:hypothetical protein